MQKLLDMLNEFFLVKLGWTWLIDYATVIFTVAALLVLILIIVIIAVAARHAKNKKKFKKMQAQIDNGASSAAPAPDEATLRADIEQQVRYELEQQYADREPQSYDDRERIKAELRDELESEIRSQVEAQYADGMQPPADGNAELMTEINELNATIDEKNARIDELGALLMQSNSDRTTDNSELYKQLNSLSRENGDLQKELNALRDENTRLKSKTSAQSGKSTGRTVSPRTGSPVPKTTSPAKTPKTVDLDDDDEIYNDYGDADSAVKVTLKFDRAKSSWVIYRSDTTRAYRRIGTKQEALVVAKDLAKRLHAQLVVHKKDGKFQKT